MSVSYHGARFGGGHASFRVGAHPITDDQLMQMAPSVFAVEKHESRSDKFAYIPTYEIVKGMRAQGFEVVAAVQGRSRVAGKAEFTKHMLRFRHPDYASQGRMGGVAPESVLVNAHDGTSSYMLFSGIFRSICTNSLIVMEDGGSQLRIPHKGDVMGKVIEGSFEVIEDSRVTLDKAAEWQGIALDRDEQMILAEAMHVVRFGDAEGNVTTPIQPRALLAPRRQEDIGADLWRVHNVVQENVVRGGMHAWGRGADGRRRQTTAREVNAIDGTVKLNRALWLLSSRMAALKSGIAA